MFDFGTSGDQGQGRKKEGERRGGEGSREEKRKRSIRLSNKSVYQLRKIKEVALGASKTLSQQRHLLSTLTTSVLASEPQWWERGNSCKLSSDHDTRVHTYKHKYFLSQILLATYFFLVAFSHGRFAYLLWGQGFCYDVQSGIKRILFLSQPPS